MEKRNFLFVSLSGLISDIAWQVSKEGHEVRYYIADKKERDIADGFVAKSKDWEKDAEWADILIFDDTLGQGEKAAALRAQGKKVGSLNLTFLQPMASGLKEIMQGFKKVITIEGNWSDDPNDEIIDENNRRYSALATLLRSRYLVDVDCWSEVRGQPIKPNTIERVMLEKLKQK